MMRVIGSVVLDRYVVEEELGRGAMGTVYRGRHVKLKRSVAIKIMHEHLLGQPELRERFRREASAAGKLAHPNIVGVLDVGEVGRQASDGDGVRAGPSLASCDGRTASRACRCCSSSRQLLQRARATRTAWASSIAISSPTT